MGSEHDLRLRWTPFSGSKRDEPGSGLPRVNALTKYLYWNVVPPGRLTVAFHTGYEAEESAI
jgi:hypothetical protein